MARGSPKALLINIALIGLYWLTSSAQFSTSPLEVVHATLGAWLTLFILGHSVRVGFLGKTKFEHLSLRASVAFDLVTSILILTPTACFLSISYSLTMTSLGVIVGCVIIGSNVREMYRISTPSSISRSTIRLAAYPAVISAYGILIAFIFRHAFAWPSMPGWDTYVHLGVSNWIQTHDGSNNLFPISSGSILPYPLVFHVMVAAFSDILGISPYGLFWLSSFYLIPAYGLIVYGITRTLSKSRIQSLFAALLAASISGGEVLLGPQYLFPSTAFIIVFILSLIAIVESPLSGLWQAMFSLSALAVSLALYYYPLFLAVVPLVIFQSKRTRSSLVSQWRGSILLTSIGASMLLTYLASTLVPGLTLTLNVQSSIFRSAYSDVVWLLVVLGSLVVVRRFSRNRFDNFTEVAIVLYVAVLIALYFSPISASDRSELMLRPFVAVVASYCIPLFSGIFSKTSEGLAGSGLDRDRFFESADWLGRLSLIVFIAFSAATLVQPYLSYGQHVPSWSNISDDEYQAAQWLKQNTPTGGYVLTDPSTGFVLRGLTLLNSSTSFIIGGHTPSPKTYTHLTSVIYGFFTSQNLTVVLSYLQQLPQSPNFVVVTTRTASWASWGGINSTFPAPTVNKLSSFAGFDKFESSLFVSVVNWHTVQIYRTTETQ